MQASLPLQQAFHLAFDFTDNLLSARWPEYVPDQILQQNLAEVLATAHIHNNCQFWLMDLRGCQWLPSPIGQWIGGPFAQQATHLIGAPVFIACLLDPWYDAAASSREAASNQRAAANHNFYPFFFGNEADARAWLQHQQELDPEPIM